EDAPALLRIAERAWWALGEADHREALAAHPKIGARHQGTAPADETATTARWARDEQQATGAAATSLLDELAAANLAYEERHGFIFIVCATGRSAEGMLEDLRARLPRSTAEELRTAAEEQAKITRLRLAKLLGELA
ncbi:MAG TPA: 2-oxo-4-hydroxy-4-carboxy-5-ureidoimidazoline decarboxylase, partial [Kofleriaceae bacterium]|nr:2-oxo-4-hydroxy-4-carboxy-5-ureidoimidazoline decarboxylase [Kofleriaceae bacterium]